MDILSLVTHALPAIIKTVGGAVGLGGPAGALADAIAGASPEKKAELAQAIAALDLETLKVKAGMVDSDNKVEIAELQSTDKYVSRARPTGLYVAYFTTLTLVLAIIAYSFAKGTPIPTDVILALLVPCWGHAGYYAFSRTQEKKAGVA